MQCFSIITVLLKSQQRAGLSFKSLVITGARISSLPKQTYLSRFSSRFISNPSSGMGTVSEYGTWKSPISSALVSENSIWFQELHVDSAGGKYADTVYWSELRYDEGGRCVVCSQKLGQEGFTAWTPEGFNARTRVHEYGGGSFFVHKGAVYFSNFGDQCLYVQQTPDSTPVALSPEDSGWRFADGQFVEKLQHIYSVREDHSGIKAGTTKEAVNTVVAINPETKEQKVLASGMDFYSSPRVSPDGKNIAWVQWSHPNMPWDNTEIMQAELTPCGSGLVEGSMKKIVGGEDSVMQPRWTTDNQLLYIGDQTDWWNLYQVLPSGEHINLAPQEKEIGVPHWTFGNYRIAIDPDGSGKIVTVFDGALAVLDPSTKQSTPIKTGFDSHSHVNWSSDGHVYCLANSPTKFPCVIRVNITTGKVDVVRESRSVPVDEGYLSIPEKISWPTDDGAVSHGYLYMPKNKDFQGPASSLPPLLVRAHGGPTSCASPALNLKQQYWTSRGYALLDVDYRGSTGYGKPYRHALRQNWGVHDIADCSNGASYLAKQGKVDVNRLCIDGGSAGGFTTLACLAFKNVFKAGCSHYGVADLSLLAEETHKFESRYLDTMIGPYIPETKHIYDGRSPFKHLEGFNCPVAFFQGDEDEIVPPNQAELMFQAIKDKGLPAALVMFKGEQHGFRKSENIQKALDGEFYFFAKVFGFEPADKTGQLDIVNLK